MTTLDVINTKKAKVGAVSLSEDFLKKKANEPLVYEAVRHYLAGQHHGTVKTKKRSEVSFTGKKIYRQKGTGNARHGSKKTTPFVGGGRVFGPQPRSFAYPFPKKKRRLAMREALKSRLMEGAVVVLDALPLVEIKTKRAAEIFSGLDISGALVVLEAPSSVASKSIRNLKGFGVVVWNQLNIFDVLKYPKLIMTQGSFEKVKGHYLM